MQATVAVNDGRISTHIGATPSSGPFTIDFPWWVSSEVVVEWTPDGVTAPGILVEGLHYTITGSPAYDDGSFGGGVINLLWMATGGTLTRYRNTRVERLSNYPLEGYFSRLALNADLNRITMALQDYGRRLGDFGAAIDDPDAVTTWVRRTGDSMTGLLDIATFDLVGIRVRGGLHGVQIRPTNVETIIESVAPNGSQAGEHLLRIRGKTNVDAPANDSNDTQIATTAFVRLIASGGSTAFLPLSGGTLTGNLEIRHGTVPDVRITNTSAPANFRQWRMMVEGDGKIRFSRVNEAGVEQLAYGISPILLPVSDDSGYFATTMWVRDYIDSVGGGGGGGLPTTGGTLTGDLQIQTAAMPGLWLWDTAGLIDNRKWRMAVDHVTGELRFGRFNDAGIETHAYSLAPTFLTAGDSSGHLATTQWVKDRLNGVGGGGYLPLAGGTLLGPLTVRANTGTGPALTDYVCMDAPVDYRWWRVGAAADGTLWVQRITDAGAVTLSYKFAGNTPTIASNDETIAFTAWVRAYATANFLPSTGGTSTGNLVIATPAGPSLWFDDAAAPVNYRRWRIMVDDANGRLRFSRFDGASGEIMAYTLLPDFATAGEDSGALATTQWVKDRIEEISLGGGGLPLTGGTLTGDLAISKAVPLFRLNSTSAPVDLRDWRIFVDDSNGHLRISRWNGAGTEIMAYSLMPTFATASEASGVLASTQWVKDRISELGGAAATYQARAILYGSGTSGSNAAKADATFLLFHEGERYLAHAAGTTSNMAQGRWSNVAFNAYSLNGLFNADTVGLVGGGDANLYVYSGPTGGFIRFRAEGGLDVASISASGLYPENNNTKALGSAALKWLRVDAQDFVAGSSFQGIAGIFSSYMQTALSLVRASGFPQTKWEAFGNGTDLKNWWLTVQPSGDLIYQAINDANDTVLSTVSYKRDGTFEVVSPGAADNSLKVATTAWVRGFAFANTGGLVNGTIWLSMAGDAFMTIQATPNADGEKRWDLMTANTTGAVAGDFLFLRKNDANVVQQTYRLSKTALAVNENSAEKLVTAAWCLAQIAMMPQNIQASTYGLVLTDAGKHIYHAVAAATATWTIPANASVAFPIGASVTFVNDSANAITIAITSDTMVWSPGTTTGSRTLGQGGIATILKVTATRWLISGTGLS